MKKNNNYDNIPCPKCKSFAVLEFGIDFECKNCGNVWSKVHVGQNNQLFRGAKNVA